MQDTDSKQRSDPRRQLSPSLWQSVATANERSLRYPLLELGSAAVIVLPSIHEGYIDPFTITLGLTLWIFLLLAVIDHDSLRNPGCADAATDCSRLSCLYPSWESLMGRPDSGRGVFGVQWLLSRGRVLGSGDILIGIAMGFILGSWLPTLIGIGLSYIIGAIAAGTLLITGKYHQRAESHSCRICLQGRWLRWGWEID